MKRFYQSLNSSVRFPVPVFDKPDEGAQGGEQQQEQQQNDGQEQQQAKQSPSKFGAGLGQFRQSQEQNGNDEGRSEEDDQQPVKIGEDGRPENVPVKFWDAEKKEVRLDSVLKAYNALEAKQTRKEGDGEGAPEKPEDYFPADFSLDPEVDRIGLEADDPGLKAASKVFHKYGISKTAAMGIVKDMFKEMNQHAPVPIDPAQEFKSLGANAQAIVDANIVWLEGLERDGKLGDADADIAINLMQTAAGARFLNKMRGLSGQLPIPVSHGAPSASMSPEEWHSEMQQAVKDKDYKRQEELDGLSARVFGSTAASGSPIRGNAGY